MNEKLQYASMLEIPVNTCSVTVRSGKARKKRSKSPDTEQVKSKLINKVNAEIEEGNFLPKQEEIVQEEMTSEIQVVEQKKPIETKIKKKKSGFSIIGAQIAVVGILIMSIFLTNAFYPESGINVLLNEVFSVEQMVETDMRTYKDFAPVLALDENSQVVLEGGTITLNGKSSVYSACDGKVSSVVKGEDGKFSITISHNKNFSTVLSGLDHAFCSQGDSVFSNIPVGYIKDGGAQMCFYGADGQMISDYQLEGSSVIWAV